MSDPSSIPKLPFPCVGSIGAQGRGEIQGTASTRKLQYVNESHKRLEELDFDPIEELVVRYRKLGDRIDAELEKPRPSSILIGQLESLRQKCASDLLRYGYARVSETSTVKTDAPPAFVINTFRRGEDTPSE